MQRQDIVTLHLLGISEYRTMEIVHDALAIPYDGDRSNTVLGRLQYCTMEIDTVLALNTVRWRSVRYTVQQQLAASIVHTMEIVTMLQTS